MSVITYDSRKNIMKRQVYGTEDIEAPTISEYVLNYGSTVHEIPHGLTYTPVFRVFYEPFGDGVIWPPLSNRLSGNAQNPNNTLEQGPGLIYWADDTNLYLQLFASVNTFTGTFPVHYVVYRDFELA